ncbi:hypothetical protein J4E80_008569 [Alternaria sp. BMP 0032]|nr:hypothetical protein J4E80_008569 [Alternaria sp. BMP 0032]
MTYDGASSNHRQDDRYNPHHVVEPLISRQQSYARNMEGQQSSPAPTVMDTHIEHPHPLRPNLGPGAPVRDADPKKATDRIRLSVVWDATTLNVWLDLNEYGEDFYQAFQQQAAKQRKDILDRTTMRIQLKKDKSLPYEEAYSLSLDEDELEADWETTCEWLNANKRDKMPHIYGVVETDGG